MRSKTVWVGALLALLGCESAPVDLGDDRDPVSIGASLSDYQGTWVGYVEIGKWDDGTGDIRIELDAQGNGVLEVGQAEPLEPPVVDDGYPRDAEYAATASIATNLLPGFSYPIIGATVESKRIRLQTSSAELYREYCELQTPMPVPSNPGSFNCMGISSYSSSGDPEDPCTLLGAGDEVLGMIDDCDPLICFTACECTESECLPHTRFGIQDTQLDAELSNEGEELVGTLALPDLSTGRPMYRVVMLRE
jgi:hypothetical protein